MEELKNILKSFINSQNAFNQRVEREFANIKGQIEATENRLTKRIDKIGKSLAFLEDDTPTRREFDDLKRDVDLIKQKVGSAA